MEKIRGMRNRGWVGLTVALAIVLLLASLSWAIETSAIGEGRTRQEAINNGLQSAVEQALGTLVKSQTQVTDGKLIWDRIASASAGYVKSYDVIAEGKDPVSDIYKVKLNVILDDPKLKNAIDEFMADPRAKTIFNKVKFDRRKVVVLYVPRTKFDLPSDSKGVYTVMDLIQDRLVKHKFRVFLQEQLIKLNVREAEKLVDEESAIDLVRKEKGDAAVVVSYDGAVRPTADGYKTIMCTLSLKAYDTRSGELFANVQDRGKTISRGGEYGIEDGVARIAIQIGPDAVDNLTKKIVEHFTHRDKVHILVLRDASVETQRAVKGILENLGWDYQADITGTLMEIEIFTEADPTTVHNTLDKEFVKASLPLSPKSVEKNRMVFEGKARGGF